MRLLIRDLTPGVNYAIQLQSNDGEQVSDWSRVFYILTGSDTIAPKMPTGFVGTMAGTSFKYDWNIVTQSEDNSPAADLDHYEVKIESTGTGVTSTYQTKDNKFELSLEQNTMIFSNPRANIGCSVAAVDHVGNKSTFTSVAFQTNAAPAQPANFVATAMQDGVNLKWSAVTDLDIQDYQIFSGTTAGFTPAPANLVYRGNVTAFVHFNIAYGTDTFYKLAAVDVFNTPSTYAASGAIRPTSPFGVDSTAPAVPTGLAATLTTASDLTTSAAVSWTAVADPSNDLASYIIGYRPVGAADWQYVTVDYTNVSIRIDRLTPYVNYEFRIRSSDWSANLSAWSATVTTSTAAVDTAPSQPSAPTAVANTLQVQVTHDKLKQAGGALESDVISLDVYASTTSGFTAAAANKIGNMPIGPTVIGAFYLPASSSTPAATTQTWYIRVIAIDRGGNSSVASNQTTTTPGLVAGINIIDATISNAKIADLVANKITAGTGFINAIDVKTTFTLGDASTDGTIKSFGYVAGTTGFSLAKSGLEINQGSIAAAALKIQQGVNRVPVEYAGFEFAPNFYESALIAGGFTKTIALTGAKYGTQHLQLRSPTAAANEIYFGNTVTDYNIIVEAGKTYIISAWIKGGPVTSNFSFRAKYSDGTSSALFGTTTVTANAAYARLSSTLLIPAGVSSMVLRMDCSTATINAGWDVDGIQVEEKWGVLTTPSTWTPSSATYVDGGYIRTGQIQSNSTVLVNGMIEPAWFIDMAGTAQLGDALIRGKMLVGVSGDDVDEGQSFISSGNFITGSSGWKIDSAGDVEFSTGLFRGLILGAEIKTALSGARSEQDVGGFRLYDDLENILVNMPTDPQQNASFTGDITATGLTVMDTMSIRGAQNEFSATSTTSLAMGNTPPATAPSISNDYAYTTLPSSGASSASYARSAHFESADNTYHLLVGYKVQKYTEAGAYIGTVNLTGSIIGFNPYPWSFTKIGTRYYVLVRQQKSPYDWWVEGYDTTTGALMNNWLLAVGTYPYLPTIGYEGINILISYTDNNNLVIDAYTTNGDIIYNRLCTTEGLAANLAGVITGTFDLGGAQRWIVTTRAAYATAFVYSVSGTSLIRQPNEDFPLVRQSGSGYTTGLMWNGTEFRSIPYNAVTKIGHHTKIKWTTESSKWWTSCTWYEKTQSIDLGAATAGSVTITWNGQTTAAIAYNATTATVLAALNALSNIAPGDVVLTDGPFPNLITLTWGGLQSNTTPTAISATPTGLTGGTVTISAPAYQSTQSPVATFSPVKRSRIKLTAPPFPATTPVVDSVRFFFGRGAFLPARTAMYNQTNSSYKSRTAEFNEVLFSGSVPPASNSFPTSTPARVISAALRSDLITPKWSLHGDGNAAFENISVGTTSWTSYTPTWTASTTNPTPGNMVATGSYQQIGRTVNFVFKIVLGTVFNQGLGSYSFSLPVPPAANSIDALAAFDYFDSSGGRHYVGVGNIATNISRVRLEGGVTFGANLPVVMGIGDQWACSGSYEAAAG